MRRRLIESSLCVRRRRYGGDLRRSEAPATSCTRPDVDERKCAGRFLFVNDNRAADSACNHCHIAQHLYGHVAWFVLSVLPGTVLEESHVHNFICDLPFETDVKKIIGEKFIDCDGILFSKAAVKRCLTSPTVCSVVSLAGVDVPWRKLKRTREKQRRDMQSPIFKKTATRPHH